MSRNCDNQEVETLPEAPEMKRGYKDGADELHSGGIQRARLMWLTSWASPRIQCFGIERILDIFFLKQAEICCHAYLFQGIISPQKT